MARGKTLACSEPQFPHPSKGKTTFVSQNPRRDHIWVRHGVPVGPWSPRGSAVTQRLGCQASTVTRKQGAHLPSRLPAGGNCVWNHTYWRSSCVSRNQQSPDTGYLGTQPHLGLCRWNQVTMRSAGWPSFTRTDVLIRREQLRQRGTQ